MEHLNQSEVRLLLQAAYDRNRLHHLALLAGFLHGLRVSETLAIKGRDILDAKLSVNGLRRAFRHCIGYASTVTRSSMNHR